MEFESTGLFGKKDREMAKIVIVISGGAVQSVIKPKGIELEIRDFDVEGSDIPENNDNYRQDDAGDWYQRMFWSQDQAEG
jgi:hypothetical protein